MSPGVAGYRGNGCAGAAAAVNWVSGRHGWPGATAPAWRRARDTSGEDVAPVLSPGEQRQWQGLARQLAGERELAELAAQLGKPRGGEAGGPASTWWRWSWIPLLVLSAAGLGLAVLGAHLTRPAVGITGLALLLAGYLLLVLWLTRRYPPRRLP